MSRIVLITGASGGYGKATAKAFKDNGDTVIMIARNIDKLNKAKKENLLKIAIGTVNNANTEKVEDIVKIVSALGGIL